MAFSAKSVTDWILWLAGQRGKRLSPMQLQKILYYAQGYSLGMSGEKALDDPIMAWEHGPVVPDVYHRFRNYGGAKISPPADIVIPDEMFGLIDVVVSQKSSLSAAELRTVTHEESPYSTTPRNEEITPQKLEDFFVDLFWTSDEEDEYEPSFYSEEAERNFFRNSLSQRKKKALIDACSI